MTKAIKEQPAASPALALIAQRYQVHEVLGSGGMARVHRVTDLSTGQNLALKQLVLPPNPEQRATIAALFEREFHTLAQLDHPRVIAVYDYGVDASAGHYYTMELLSGGDLRERAPLPWREACRLIFDVCSSLALLHSRRLLHRDISPRNIRCTHDGRAKLIDFGAMAPMGSGGGSVVGTPAFTAPEVLQRSTLDARTDLYSLGATLYVALTGGMAYPARDFAELANAWSFKPAPPSSRAQDIPPALDDLVLSLLSLEPELRPHSAFEVMQRLAAIAELESSEPEGVSKAYLSTPTLVGREDTLAWLRAKLPRASTSGAGGVMLLAEPGMGRSRMLDACALQAKPLGVVVLRAQATAAQSSFAVALGLVRQLLEALPSECRSAGFPELFEPAAGIDHGALRLKSSAELSANPEVLQQTICRFMLTVSRARPLLVAVDDVQRIDEPSAATLAALADKAGRGSLLVALTADIDATSSSQARDVLTRRCEVRRLEPLTCEHVRALLGSIFGDVPNLGLVAGEIYKITRGNPRECMDVAQHLLDKRVIQYAGGTWTLPALLSGSDLPSTGAEAIRARVEALSPLARFLGQAKALAYHETLSREDCRSLAAELGDDHGFDAALAELLMMQALVGDVEAYSLANRVWVMAFTADLSTVASQRCHRALAKLYGSKADLADVHHLFAGGLDEQGLDALLGHFAQFSKQFDLRAVIKMNPGRLGASHARALKTVTQLQRPARQAHELRHWMIALSTAADARYYWLGAPTWLAQLEADSGLADWRADAQNVDANARLMGALQRAQERFLATPERDRVYRVDEAIGLLAQYVAFSMAVGSRTMDNALLWTLPALLEPFAVFSPAIDALWQNALAACECSCQCQFEQARTRWNAVHDKLANITDVQHLESIRSAVSYALAVTEASLGLPSALSWAARMDGDPMQRLNAIYVRKVVRLEQGDWEGADKLRRQAEELVLQGQSQQMFTSVVAIELSAQASARDLGGVKQIMERIEVLAAGAPGWVPYSTLARGRFQHIRGDLSAALREFERVIEQSPFEANQRSLSLPAWIAAQSGRSEVLLALDRADEARAAASSALATCEALQIGARSNDLSRALALAEASLGEHAAAIERLERLISAQTTLGVSGLKLGLSYEARARVAIWADDETQFEHFARLTAREYRHGARSPLGARYESLLNEARRRGFQPNVALSDFETSTMIANSRAAVQDARSVVRTALESASTPEERSLRALQLVCESRAADGGHFFTLAGDGVRLAASHGLPIAPEGLAALVCEHLARERDSSETLTMMATSAQPDGSADFRVTAQADGICYELLVLACKIKEQGEVLGVMAVASRDTRVRDPKQAQLLVAIAQHLLRANDADASRL
jgi:hypothetical protein